MCENLEFRKLKSKLLPESYDLTLNLDIYNNLITGIVCINCFESSHQTDKIELNLKNVDILNSSLNGIDLSESEIIDHSNERLIYTFPSELLGENQPESCNLVLEFRTKFQSNLDGFYKINTPNSAVKAASIFCPTLARTCFPCFDEPTYKAVFQVTINLKNHDNCDTVLSNAPLLSKEVNKLQTYTTYKFDKSPKMSSYLLCFIVGNLDYYEQYTQKSKVRVRTYTPKNKQVEGQYSVEVACKILDFYEDYFGIDYQGCICADFFRHSTAH